MALAADVWRDFETSGVPSSGAHDPVKSGIREWAAEQEALTNAIGSNGGLVYATLAELNADLGHAAYTSAWVIAASDAGIYQKSGAVDAGSWSRIADLTV